MVDAGFDYSFASPAIGPGSAAVYRADSYVAAPCKCYCVVDVGSHLLSPRHIEARPWRRGDVVGLVAVYGVTNSGRRRVECLRGKVLALGFWREESKPTFPTTPWRKVTLPCMLLSIYFILNLYRNVCKTIRQVIKFFKSFIAFPMAIYSIHWWTMLEVMLV